VEFDTISEKTSSAQ